MNENQEERSGPESLLAAWMKSATEFWGSMARTWPGASETAETPTPSEKRDRGRVQESMESALKMWQTVSTTLGEPGTMDSLFHGINALPQVFIKMAQTGWERYFHLHQQWLERAGRIGEKTEAYKFENIDQEAFKAWNEIYEEEFKRLLMVPQLGLTRFYQERLARFIDKFNLFQSTMAEFMYLIYLPMEKSFKVMQEQVEEATKEGGVPATSQEYYRMWLKILEGHYMTLFKSSEYSQVQSKTLDAMEEFVISRQELLRDLLQIFPVPSNEDMDELYKEIYELKKKIKQLEKRTKKQ
jgi:class III poly(R)-hydroxyalkanoic acid synthase PhaE subunit